MSSSGSAHNLNLFYDGSRVVVLAFSAGMDMMGPNIFQPTRHQQLLGGLMSFWCMCSERICRSCLLSGRF